MAHYSTLAEALIGSGTGKKGMRFFVNSKEQIYCSYAELVVKAKEGLAKLQACGIKKGDEVILQFQSQYHLTISLWACFLGGIIPVPLTFADSDEKIMRVLNISMMVEHPWIATDSRVFGTMLKKYAEKAGRKDDFELIASKVILPDELEDAGCACVLPELKEDDAAFLQFSSGSTGTPKGVVMTHRRIFASIESYARTYHMNSEDVFLSWMPLSHDFGIFGYHIAPVLLGMEQNIMPTGLFMADPMFWMQSVNQYRASILGSPSFGIRHFVKNYKEEIAIEEKWDLSCVKTILNAGELISKSALDQFNEILGKWGLNENAMSPCYGLTECILLPAANNQESHYKSCIVNRNKLGIGQNAEFVGEDSESAMEIVSCGQKTDIFSIRICDEEEQELGEDTVGVIKVYGDSLLTEYYKNEEATKSAFGRDGYYNTCDLGFIHEGELYVVGRIKEMIIINGVNYFPNDMEAVLYRELYPGEDGENPFVVGACYSEEKGTEELVVYMLYRDDLKKFIPIREKIRKIVLSKISLDVKYVIPIDEIPKTGSGKRQRFPLGKMFREGKFDSVIHRIDELAEEKPSEGDNRKIDKQKVYRIVQEEACRILDVDACDMDTGFMEMGFSSLKTMLLHEKLEKRLGMKISQTAILDYSTIRRLSDYLSEQCAANGSVVGKKSEADISDSTERDDIAVVGMSCRFPGNANNLKAYWELLMNQTDPIREVDKARWKQDPMIDRVEGKILGGFLENVDLFDASFFGISPREAESMDPQHRLLLELTWEAVEDAGWNKRMISGTNTGVYVGIFRSDYMHVGNDLGHYGEPYSYTGSALHSASGRISYTFNLKGPSISMDTACSSSLVAIQEAVMHLQNGDCDNAIVGGVNILMDSQEHQIFSALNALSPSGRCASYDDAADGYICSEGGAVLILKRLKDAKRDKNRIWGIVKGAAINHNGASAGFTVPSGVAQQKLIRNALEKAGLEPGDIDYIEGHGSGTKIGDPQEVNALAEVFREKADTLYLGSVKSNIGHTEAAAGLAGVIKVLLSMHYGMIAPDLHFKKGNTLIDWEHNHIRVVDKPIVWKDRNGYRRAGVTSCGLSGTNAHIILENYRQEACEAEPEREVYPVTISAGTEKALRKYIERLIAWLETSEEKIPEICKELNICHGSASRRVGFLQNGNDKAVLIDKLKKMLDAPDELGAEAKRGIGPVAFIYTGQGSHYLKMGRDLFRHSEVFEKVLRDLSERFEKRLNYSLIDFLYEGDGKEIGRPIYSQPIIFSVQVALTEYLKHLGIEPDYLIGHSIGEYAAAYVDGVMSLEDAVNMVSARAEITEKSCTEGKMMNVFAGEEIVREMIGDRSDVFFATINSKENVTLSGSCSGIDEIRQKARKRRIFVEDVPVQQPFHTRFMKEDADELMRRYDGIYFEHPTPAYISCVEGRNLGANEKMDASYWARHMSNTVQFMKAVQSAYEKGVHQFIEIGGVATLCGFVAQSLEDPDVAAFPCLRQKKADYEQLSETLCRLWMRGMNIEWSRFYETPLRVIDHFPHTVYSAKSLWYTDKREDMEDRRVMKSEIALQEQKNNVEQEIHKKITNILGTEVSSNDDLFDLGFDSLMVIQLRKAVKSVFDVELTSSQIFGDLHTVKDITQYVAEHMPVRELPKEEGISREEEISKEERIPEVKNVQVPLQRMPERISSSFSVTGKSGLEELFMAQLAIMNEQVQILKNAGPLEMPAAVGIPYAAKPSVEASVSGGAADKKASVVINEAEEEVPLNSRQQKFVDEFIERRVKATKKSKEFAGEYRNVLSDWIVGVNYDRRIKEIVYPVVSSKSKGAYFWDVDGNKYLDTCMGYGSAFFGNHSDLLSEAIKEQIDKGYELGPQTELAGKVAKLICELAKVERVAFINTGTEAVMSAIRVARAATGRDKIVRFTNSYHGTFDGVLVEGEGSDVQPMSAGTTEALVKDTVVLSYGTKDSLDYIKGMGGELAAVLVEPVQSRNPGVQPREYLKELREICTQNGIVLVFDEMVTGFRLSVGGAQEFYGIKADLVTYGKLAGGGMPIGIVAGKAKYIDYIDGGRWNYGDDSKPSDQIITFAGTYCKHPLSLASSYAALTYLKENGREGISRVNRITEDFVRKANQYFKDAQVPLFIPHCGSIYRYQTTFSTDMMMLPFELKLFFLLLLEAGVYVWERRTCYFTLAHTQEDADHLLEAIKYSVETLRKGGFSFRSAGNPKDPEKKTVDTGITQLSAEERGVYSISNMTGGNAAYQICLRYKADGDLSYEKLKECFEILSEKHEMLRCQYKFENGTIVHDILEKAVPESICVDENTDGEEAFKTFWDRPIDLKKAPLWRWALVREKNGNCYLYLKFHHIMSDGISINLLMHDAQEIYNGRYTEEPTREYGAYIESQNAYFESADFKLDENWWKEQFSPVPSGLNLPADSKRPDIKDFKGSMVCFEIRGELLKNLKEFAKKNRNTMFVTMLSMWSAFLGRISGQSDICIGFPMDGRGMGEFEHTIGMFAQTKVFRALLNADERFDHHMEQVKRKCFEIFEHANYPIDRLVDCLDMEKDMSRNPLFEVLFNYDVDKEGGLHLGSSTLTSELINTHTAQFDLFLDISEKAEGMLCKIEYAVPLYSEKRIRQWISMFLCYMEQVIVSPEMKLKEYSILDSAGKEQLLSWGNGEKLDIEYQSIAELLEKVIEKWADQPGIWYQGKELSFREIDSAAEAIAEKLKENGVSAGDSLCFLTDRNPNLLICLLAFLKTGCNWIPLDSNYPPERIEYMVENSGVKVILTEEAFADMFAGNDISVITIDTVKTSDKKTGYYHYASGDLAYTIYTSGSTGKPKGVQLEHGALINFVIGMSKALGWTEAMRTACVTTPCFDIFLLESLLCWGNGGCIVLASNEETRDPGKLCGMIKSGRADCLQMTPSRLQTVFSEKEKIKEVLSGLKMLIVGGEAFPENLLPELLKYPELTIYNVYGPTETCIWSTCKRIGSSDDKITIGKPIANTYIYILDQDGNLLPEAEVGDMWIGGYGVARGYTGNKKLTDEVFRKDPYLGDRMYKTGDLAKWSDGELVFVGRGDTQVKLRGYRIELGEIEQVIMKHPRIRSAAVLMKMLGENNPVLAAYYETEEKETVSQAEIKEWVLKSLPGYMLCDFFIQMDKMPHTGNGKIDRKALKNLALEQRIETTASEEQKDETEEKIRKAWKTILGNGDFGVQDRFFDVGGNSFSIALLKEELDKEFAGILTVSDLFSYPTISQQKQHIKEALNRENAEKYSVELDEEWFSSQGTGGMRQAVIARDTEDALRKIGQEYGVDFQNVMLAVYSIFLYKLLDATKIPLWLVKHSGTIPFCTDFEEDKEIQEIMEEIFRAVKEMEADGKTVDFNEILLADRFARIGYFRDGLQEISEIPEGMDILLQVDERTSEKKLKLFYSNRMDAFKMQEQIDQLNGFLGLFA